MKKQLLLPLFWLPLSCFAQAVFLSPDQIQTQKLTTDSVLATRIINTTIRGANTNFSISFVTGLANLHTVQSTFVQAAQGSFSQSLTTNVLSVGSFSTQSIQIGSATGATPLFGGPTGQLVRTSPLLHQAINAAAFTPERVSPLENANIIRFNGQIRVFSEGEAEMSSLNATAYRLVAPLPIALNAAQGNIRITSMKICVLDNDNSLDLVAVLHEVQDSQNSPNLITNLKMAIRSSENINQYRCFEDEKSFLGEEFIMNQAENSYYLSVFPILRTVSTDDLFKALPVPVTLDNPGLRLVHVVVRYLYE